MTEVFVAQPGELDDGTRKLVKTMEGEVVVLRINGRYHGIDNYCLHMGGPVGEGVVIGRVEARLAEDNTYLGEHFATDKPHLVCPWHGYEYELESGICAGDRSARLRKYEVIERHDGVYLRV